MEALRELERPKTDRGNGVLHGACACQQVDGCWPEVVTTICGLTEEGRHLEDPGRPLCVVCFDPEMPCPLCGEKGGR